MSSTNQSADRIGGQVQYHQIEPAQRQESAADLVDVSVCIANWNCREMLRACLASLTEEKQGVRLEVIVVDNASSDGAPEMVLVQFPNVRLIRNRTNRGFSCANNQAAQAARGRYLFFLNNDTEVQEGALRKLLEFAEHHPDAVLIGPRLRGADGEVQVSYRCRPTVGTLLHRTLLLRWTGLLRTAYLQYRRQKFDPSQTREVDILMGAAMLTPREVFLANGGWDEDFAFGGEDLELSVRLGKAGKVYFWPEVEILHYGRVSTREHVVFSSPQIAIGFAKYLRKTGTAWPALLCYKLLITIDAPITMIAKVLEFAYRRLRGDKAKAGKSLLSARGSWHFLRRGLVGFWRA